MAIDATNMRIITLRNNSASKLYALIIGINNYPNIKPLKGAVADADEVNTFLTTDLEVPSDHIINLRDSDASRERIVKAFEALRDDPRIESGDPILIYYAGHGGLRRAEEEWRLKYGLDDVQVIFPFDYGVQAPGSAKPVNCIPDKTIFGLLNKLAAAKGDNITVIFDSCHAASGTRDKLPHEPPSEPVEPASSRQARYAKVEFVIPCDIDDEIISPADVPALDPDESRHGRLMLCTNQSSHIHLAACGSREEAWEEHGRGVFTVALLKSIRASGVDKISYRNLMISLPMLSNTQTPHCYGVHKYRILFNSCVPSRNIFFIPVKFEEDTLILQAGAASGVTFKSVWALHESPTEDSPRLGRFYAETPKMSTAVLKPENVEARPLSTGTRLYARQVQCGTGNELRVWFSPEAKKLIFPETETGFEQVQDAIGSGAHEVGYVTHPARDSAEIAVEVYRPDDPSGNAEPQVTFHLCNRQAEILGVSTLQQRKPARRDEVETVLFAAAKWNWHLQRTTSRTLVKMEIMKVARREGDNDYKLFKEPGANLNTNGVVDFVVSDDLYGINLTNQAGVPLYVRMFYFDTTNFSIVDLFGHTCAKGRSEPDLYKRLLIGDDREGGMPIPFELYPGEKLDLGYLKVFWSADPLELDNLEQDSAFEMKPGRGDRRPDISNLKGDWGTVLVTMVQRAEEA